MNFDKAKIGRSLEHRLSKIKPILIKRKSAFTVWEWIYIKETLKIHDTEPGKDH